MCPGVANRWSGRGLPPDIHADLVGTLFGTVGSFVSGIVGGLTVPALAWFRTGDDAFLLCSAILIAFSAMRIAVFVAHRRGGPEAWRLRATQWEIAYAVGGVGFMTTVGVLGAMTLDGRHDPITALYGAVSVLGCAGSLAGRNAGRPLIVVAQSLGLFVPVTVALILRLDPWYWGLALILILVLTSVLSTTKFLNVVLVSALLAGRESRHRGQQLGIALDSMTHGLCMAASDGSITVLNQRLRDAFDLSDAAPPATLDDLAKSIAASCDMPAETVEPFAATFHRYAGGREPRHWTETLGSRIFLFRSQPMESGGSVVVVEDVTEARRSAQQIEYLAHFDPLTGLVNRYQFHQRLGLALTAAAARHDIALLAIDLDRFKEVNDTQGHPAGDALLRQVAQRLEALSDPSIIVARFGGDEFQILLNPVPPGLSAETFAREVIERISEPYLVEGQAVSIGASIGIAIAPEDGRDGDELLRRADMALYGAKALSRGTALRFTPDMDVVLHRRRQTERELRDALTTGQITVFYQPMVDIRTGRVSACEALVRWHHPERGLVRPDDFIPVAEECGLIADLGLFVLRRACEDALLWPSDVRVSVNVSPRQFLLQRDLVDRILQILAETGLPPQRLEIELTESALLETNTVLSGLVEAGVRISLDDFGTGYSSLSYLRLFTIHKIKIDRSFVRIGDPASLAIIEAVAFIARTLDIELVVEGVETEDQLKIMAERRICLIQGYLFSRPKPLRDILPMLDGTLDISASILRAVA